MSIDWSAYSQQVGVGSAIGVQPTSRTFTYPEIILRELRVLYGVEYANSLATVQTFWQSHPLLTSLERELQLYDFAERILVADPAAPGSFSQFPALALAAGAMTSSSPRSQQGFDWYTQNVQLVYMLRGLSQEELSVIILRHIQATLDLFDRFPTANLSGQAFTVAGSPTFTPSANVLEDGGNALVKGLLVVLNIRFQGASIR